jgi:REase_AHJR-like
MTTDFENSTNQQRFHSDLEARVAEKYQRQGFSVIANPGFSLLPFDLGGYKPDLIAQKEPDQNFIIEVKSSSRQLSVDRFRSIAEIVRAHPGWQFLLVTADDELPIGSELDLIQYDEALLRADHAEALIAGGAAEAAFLFLWSTLEGMMRRRSMDSNIPIERLTPLAMINHLYSQGELSREQFHAAKELVSIRNRAVHGYRDPQLEAGADRLLLLVRELATEWRQH